MVASDEREFKTFDEGVVRDQIILLSMRNSMRALRNPDSGNVFTEDEIQVATQPGSRFYIEADAIDQYGQAMQARALWLSDQIDPARANGRMLEDLHGRLWFGKDSRLAATGAGGDTLAKGTPGATFIGSTTVPDPVATVGSDPNGNRYQVLQTEAIGVDGTALISIQGIDTGFVTNLDPGEILKWSENVPLGVEPEASIQETIGEPGVGLKGGFDIETHAEYAQRIEERIADRPAAGNPPHIQVWAQQASGAVERAFVYPAALHAGSVVVVITQRRNQNTTGGPLGRFPTAGTLAAVSTYLTPPNSPAFPQRAFVLAQSPQSQPSDMVMRISMNQGVGGGWADVTPWPAPDPLPGQTIEDVQISAVTSQTVFEIATPLLLPGGATLLSGVNAPQIMVWDKDRSRFEKLAVAQIENTTPGVTQTVTLSAAPEKTIAVEDRISPFTDRLDVIAVAFEAFFDNLGPSELVEDTDLRAARAARQPFPSAMFPQRAGETIVSGVVDSLGGVATGATLPLISRTEPDIPGEIADGPNMLTLGHVNIFPL